MCTHLFWTGGWDSTFRLLQNVLEEKRVVQAYYILAGGTYVGKEVLTMIQIRRYLFDHYPESRKLLKPIIFYDKRMIERNEEITETYKKTKELYPIKLQYETFARFCHHFDIHSMELSVLKNETIDYELANKVIFKYFTYPLLGYTKKKMAEIAKEKNWEEIMAMTWFCRKPVNDRPCGFCGPCSDVAMAGMSKRLPLKARIIAKIQTPFRKFWRNNYRLQSNGIFQFVQRLFKGKY